MTSIRCEHERVEDALPWPDPAVEMRLSSPPFWCCLTELSLLAASKGKAASEDGCSSRRTLVFLGGVGEGEDNGDNTNGDIDDTDNDDDNSDADSDMCSALRLQLTLDIGWRTAGGGELLLSSLSELLLGKLDREERDEEDE